MDARGLQVTELEGFGNKLKTDVEHLLNGAETELVERRADPTGDVLWAARMAIGA